MLLEHEALGQTARFERFVARLLFTIAAGEHIDKDRSEQFSAQVDAVYANPFKEAEKEMTAEEIKGYVVHKLEGLLHGSNDACGENRP